MSTENDNRRVVICRRIAATREELFDAWIDPEGMKDWMCPGDVAAAEVQMNARVHDWLCVAKIPYATTLFT